MDSWAIVFATFFGPVFAVLMTMVIDKLRMKRRRRMEIFQSLVANRRSALSPDRVKALNLVEVDFYGKRDVLKAHRDLMDHVAIKADDLAQWNDRTRTLGAKLLSEMAKVLRYRKLEQLDLREGGYWPQLYVDIEADQAVLRRLLVELLSGNRSLPIHPAAPTPPPNFPPAPPKPTATS